MKKTLTLSSLTLVAGIAFGSLASGCYAPLEDGIIQAGMADPMALGMSANRIVVLSLGELRYTAYEPDRLAKKVVTLDSASYAANVSMAEPTGADKNAWVVIAGPDATSLYQVKCPRASDGCYPSSTMGALTAMHRQAKVALRADGRIEVLGRSRPAHSDNGLPFKTDLLLLTVSADGKKILSQKNIAAPSAVDPVLALHAPTEASVAAWKDPALEATSAQLTDASGNARIVSGIQPGSPRAAWTDSSQTRIASTDASGTLFLSDGEASLAAPALPEANRCAAFDYLEDGTLLALTVSDQAVTLTQVALDGSPSSLQLAGAVSPIDEVSRSTQCTISHKGARIRTAWKGTQSVKLDGNIVSTAVLLTSVEDGKVIETRRLRAEEDKAQLTVKIAIAGDGQGSVQMSWTSQECFSADYKLENGSSPAPENSKCSFWVGHVGDKVTLIAKPDSFGSTFVGWSNQGQPAGAWNHGCIGTNPTCTLPVDQAQTVTAVFGPAPF